MKLEKNNKLDNYQYYLTAEYDCGYLKHHRSQSLVVAHPEKLEKNEVSNLISNGFRRSGIHIYKPDCKSCNKCIPIRVDVTNFRPNRTQKRIIKRYQYLDISLDQLEFSDEDFLLYDQYQKIKHNEFTDSDKNNRNDYINYLLTSNTETKKITFKHQSKLKIITILDIFDNSISAVYTFYDVKSNQESYGTYSILWLIEWAKKNKIKHIYLGYWINESVKMRYKTNFKPFELLINNQWQQFYE
ncbi:MAG: arginyltransferase [Nitrosomonadales bacterium]